MILRRLFAAVALLCAIAPSHAQPFTKAQLSAQFTVNFPNQTAGFITPADLVLNLDNIINSIMPTAPVVSGNFPCFDGTTGLLKDCGVGPTTTAITALTGDATATGPGSVPLTLPTVNSNVGSFGSATQCPT